MRLKHKLHVTMEPQPLRIRLEAVWHAAADPDFLVGQSTGLWIRIHDLVLLSQEKRQIAG